MEKYILLQMNNGIHFYLLAALSLHSFRHSFVCLDLLLS